MLTATATPPILPAPAVARDPPQARPAASAPPAPLAPGTRLRIEPSLRLVVVEFREPDGEMRASVPTPREIDAYRNPPLPAPAPGLDLRG